MLRTYLCTKENKGRHGGILPVAMAHFECMVGRENRYNETRGKVPVVSDIDEQISEQESDEALVDF